MPQWILPQVRQFIGHKASRTPEDVLVEKAIIWLRDEEGLRYCDEDRALDMRQCRHIRILGDVDLRARLDVVAKTEMCI